MTEKKDVTASTTPTPPSMSESREVVISYIAIVVSVALTATIAPAVAREYLYSFILAAMVYLPVLRGEKRGRRLSEYGIHLKNWKKEILFAAALMLIVFPPFIIGNHFWQSWVVGGRYAFALPAGSIAYLILEHTLFIALPEEFFYRGWMQTVFTRRFPAKLKIWGGDFGWVIILTSALFAIGHLAAIPSPFRLAVFFPSLLFCWIRAKRGSLIAPILFHGACNVLMNMLNACYH